MGTGHLYWTLTGPLFAVCYRQSLYLPQREKKEGESGKEESHLAVIAVLLHNGGS
jgi:hypothetical protein